MRWRAPVCGAALVCTGVLSGFLQAQVPTRTTTAGGPGAAQAASPLAKAGKYVPDELIVRFRPGAAKLRTESIHTAMRTQVVRRFDRLPGLEVVRLPAGMSVPAAARAYRKIAEVLYAEPNYIVHTDQSPVVPNDPRFGELWGLHNTGQNGGVAGADIDAQAAWGITTGSSNVVVAVIDTGIDYLHEDLAANMFQNTPDCNSDGLDNDNNGFIDDCFGIDVVNGDSDPMDDAGHGTHVAGTIGAAGNNGVGVVGVNWQVKIIACKFLDEFGFGSTAGAITCLNYLADLKDRGVNLIASNNSWGGGGFSQALVDAIDAHRQRGILFVASAGNNGRDTDAAPAYPANFPVSNIVAVAATNRNDALASFSNFGRRGVHVGAPGQDILSSTPFNTYSTFSGTSMAAPHVTGVAALLSAQDSTRDWRAIKNLIMTGGDTIPAVASTISQRRLNAHGSMTCSNSTLLSRVEPRATVATSVPGLPVVLAVLHINCANPNGSVQVTIDPGATQVTLLDDGVGADQEAGDGVYSAQFTPATPGTHTLTFPGSDVVTVHALSPYGFSSSAPFSYRTITGTNLNLTDDSTAQITSPFPVQFGGGSFTTLYVNSNGNVTFGGGFTDFINEPIPTAAVQAIVAVLWDDLLPTPSGNVFWQVTGAQPSRELVIEWRNIGHYPCGGAVKFQAIFFEANSDVLFNYADTSFDPVCGTFFDAGADATVGVQVASVMGTQFSFDTPALADNTAILWQVGQLTPTLTKVSPFTAAAGDPGLTLSLSGSGFVPGSTVRWNGSDRPTIFVNSVELTASIAASDLAAAGVGQVTVFNAPPNGTGESAALPFNIYSSYPVPSLASVVPGTVEVLPFGRLLSVTGTDFVSNSVVRWNGADRPTIVLSSTELSVSIPPSDVATTGTAQLTVFNPAPGGGESSPLTVAIENAVPEVFFADPPDVDTGSPGFTLDVFGFGFVAGSVVRWNGADRPTTYVDTFQVSASIPASDLLTPGFAQVAVFNPAPGGGLSPTATQVAVSTFSIAATPANLSVPRGQSGNFNVTANVQFGYFSSLVTLDCGTLPAGLSCAFNPPGIIPGVGGVNSTMSISTAGLVAPPTMTAAKQQPVEAKRSGWPAPAGLGLAVMGFVLVAAKPQRRRNLAVVCSVGLLVALSAFQFACGGGSTPPPPPCSFTLSPTSQSVTAAGGPASVNVSANRSNCSWQASSNAAFLNITSGSSGTGSGMVNFTVASNSAITPRSGTLTIAGQTHTVNEAGVPITITVTGTSGTLQSSAQINLTVQ